MYLSTVIGSRALCRSTRLGLCFCLLLLFFLLLLLLSLVLLISLSLQRSFLLVCLGNNLEEAFQSSLLRALGGLLQSRTASTDSVLVEALVSHEELNETLDIRLLPLDVAQRVVCRADIRLEEQCTRILEGPVIGQRVLGVILDVFNDLLKGAVLSNQFQGCAGTNLGDRVEVIATEKNAEIDELSFISMLSMMPLHLGKSTNLLAIHVQSLEDLIHVDFLDRLLSLLAEGQVA